MPKPIRAKIRTIDIDRGEKKLRAQIKIMKNEPFVKVGIQRDAGSHDSGTPMVLIASANEFGTRDGRIPSRSFIRSTMDENRPKLVSETKTLIKRIAQGRFTAIQALNILGERITSLIRRKITTLSEPPNAPSTVAKKGSSNPLVDTGQMRASIRHVVEDGK